MGYASGTSPFQTLMLTLAGRVGVGNIAGVAVAVFSGGPGALLWMFVSTLLATGTAFSETVLGQVYKRKIEGEYRGGAPFYIEHGLKKRWIGMVVAVVFIVAYVVFIPGMQANALAAGVEGAFQIPAWITALVLVVALAVIAVGGTDRIVKVCQLIVPVLGVFYIGFAVYVLALNYTAIWDVTRMVFGAAFGYDALFGGMVGTAVAWGVRRAMHSTGVGFGESVFGAASSAVSHPVKQGLVQAFSALASILIAMATGVMLLITSSYNVSDGAGGCVVRHLPGVEEGTQFTQSAIDSVISGFGPAFIAVALFFFAFTTLVSYIYIVQTNLAYLRDTAKGPWMWACTGAMLLFIFYGSVNSAENIWAIGDFAYAIITWINLAVNLLLLPVVLRTLRDYDLQKKAGLDPVFDPIRARVDNAEFWVHFARRQREEAAAQARENDGSAEEESRVEAPK